MVVMLAALRGDQVKSNGDGDDKSEGTKATKAVPEEMRVRVSEVS